MKLISWNVNGIRSAAKKGLLDYLANEQADVLCLQETKADPQQLPASLLEIPGYTAWFHSGERKGYSGVALYARKPPLRVRSGFGIARYDREGRVLIADYGWFILYNLYVPNGKSGPERLAYKMDFYGDLKRILEDDLAAGRSVVVCGDINTAHREIDLARPRENRKVSGFLPEECAFLDSLIETGFVDTFRHFCDEAGHYSWWDVITRARERNVGWRIDYWYVSRDLLPRVREAFIQPEVMGSDHCPVGLVLAEDN